MKTLIDKTQQLIHFEAGLGASLLLDAIGHETARKLYGAEEANRCEHLVAIEPHRSMMQAFKKHLPKEFTNRLWVEIKNLLIDPGHFKLHDFGAFSSVLENDVIRISFEPLERAKLESASELQIAIWEKFSSPKNPRTKWWPYTNHVPSCAGDEDIYDEMALVLADMLPYIFTVLQEKKSCSEVTELLKEYKDDTPSEPGMPVRFVSPAFLYVYGFYIAAAAYWAYTEAFRTLLDERGKVVIAHIGTFEKTSSGVTFTGEQSMLELIEANIEE